MLGVQAKQADIFTEDTLFSLVGLLRAPSLYSYIHPGSAGTVYKREIWPTWDRETATTQNQDFAKLLKNRKRWGMLWTTKKKYYLKWFHCMENWPWFNLLWQVQKLQNIIASRASQYSHDAKRKEREAAKLKERLSQLLIDRKDKKLGKYRQKARCSHRTISALKILNVFFSFM